MMVLQDEVGADTLSIHCDGTDGSHHTSLTVGHATTMCKAIASCTASSSQAHNCVTFLCRQPARLAKRNSQILRTAFI